MTNILCAACISAASAICDLRTGKIPNIIILVGSLGGLVRQYLLSGWIGALNAVVSGCLILVLLFPWYRIRGIGAGDVKLLAAAALWLTPADGILLLILTLSAAAVISVIRMIRQHELGSRFMLIRSYINDCITCRDILAYTTFEKSSSYIRMAPCVLSACLLMLFKEVIL